MSTPVTSPSRPPPTNIFCRRLPLDPPDDPAMAELLAAHLPRMVGAAIFATMPTKPDRAPDFAYDLFIAAPMSALDPSAYFDGRAEVLAVVERLSAVYDFGPIYFAGTEIPRPDHFTSEADALRRDLTALRGARQFVLFYPGKIVTSALVEVGYALALHLPCLLLVRNKSDLPYLLNQAEQSGADDLVPPLRIALLGEPAQTARQIADFRDELSEAAGG